MLHYLFQALCKHTQSQTLSSNVGRVGLSLSLLIQNSGSIWADISRVRRSLGGGGGGGSAGFRAVGGGGSAAFRVGGVVLLPSGLLVGGVLLASGLLGGGVCWLQGCWGGGAGWMEDVVFHLKCSVMGGGGSICRQTVINTQPLLRHGNMSERCSLLLLLILSLLYYKEKHVLYAY